MNRATRNKFAKGTNRTDLTTGNACWETPPLVFDRLEADFGPFDIDLTADRKRHLCARWFGPGGVHHDALADDPRLWCEYGLAGFSNPPYGPFVQRMLKRAKAEAARGFSTTLLLPMRVTAAFKRYVLKQASTIGASDLLFCNKRITFFENGLPRLNERAYRTRGKGRGDPAMFDSIIVRFTPRAKTFNVGLWTVPVHVTPSDLARALARRRRRIESAAKHDGHLRKAPTTSARGHSVPRSRVQTARRADGAHDQRAAGRRRRVR